MIVFELELACSMVRSYLGPRRLLISSIAFTDTQLLSIRSMNRLEFIKEVVGDWAERISHEECCKEFLVCRAIDADKGISEDILSKVVIRRVETTEFHSGNSAI